MKKFLSIALLFFVCSVATAQVHIPSFTLDDSVEPVMFRKLLTVDGDWASIAPDADTPEPLELVSGVILNNTISLVSGNTISPIQWRLAPGTYTLDMWGRTDDGSTLRNKVTETVMIVLSRSDEVIETIERYNTAFLDTLLLDIQPSDLDAISSVSSVE